MVPTVVIGTAGHIDHGKTALLRALTGIDADRLPEERARGMTIDVGYAHLTFDDGVELDFVDVPGHDRLIGNMLVGAGEIDVAMLVVAADDGPRPQTLEHLQLLDALGIAAGLAVVTKIDVVDAARVGVVVDEVRELLRPTWLASAAIVPVASTTGVGIEPLRREIRVVRDAVVERWRLGEGEAGASGPLRLVVDRVFTSKGRGIVVTGSLRGGSVRAGDSLRREPGGEVVRVREVQVHGAARDHHDGGRTALNLVGSSVGELRRGDVLTTGPRVRGTDRLLVARARRAPFAVDEPRKARSGSRLRLHVGTDQVDARIRRIPGVESLLLVDLDRAAATFPGDRAVLREPGGGEVVGGVMVLETQPPRGVSRRRMTPERLEALAAAVVATDIDGVQAARIELHGVLATDFADEGQAVPRTVAFAEDVRAAVAAVAIESVAAHHREAHLSPGLSVSRARAALLRRLRSIATVSRRDAAGAAATVDRLLEGLVADGRLARRGEALRDPLRTDELPAELGAAMDRLEAALGVPAPPALSAAAATAGCPPEGIRTLQADGRIVRLGPDLAWATTAYHRLAAAALDRARSGPLTPAAFRDATGTSRKYVLPILEDLDRRGLLQRTPKGHVPGPRAPRPEPAPAS